MSRKLNSHVGKRDTMMFLANQGRQQLATALLSSLLVIGSAAPSSAGEINWVDVGILGASSWHDPTHWGPIVDPGPGGPQVYAGIPRDQDTVVVDITDGRTVELNGNTAPVNGLFLSNNNQLNTNGHRLIVDNGGSAPLTVSGTTFSLLSIGRAEGGPAIATDHLNLMGSARSFLYDGAIVQVDTHASLETDTAISGLGELRFGTKTTPKNQRVLRNNGSFQPVLWFSSGATADVGNLTLTALGGGTLDLDGHLELPDGSVEEPGHLDFANVFETELDHLSLIVDGPLSDPFGGTLEIGSANTADFRHAWSADTGTIRLRGTNATATLTGAPLTADGATVSALGENLVASDLMLNSGRVVLGEFATLELAGTTNVQSAVDINMHPNTTLKISGRTTIDQATWDASTESVLQVEGGELRLTGGTIAVDEIQQANILRVDTLPTTLAANSIHFHHDSRNTVDSTLTLRGTTNVRKTAEFAGGGQIINSLGSQLTVHGAEMSLPLRNDGLFHPEGDVHVRRFVQTESARLQLNVEGITPDLHDHLKVDDLAILDGELQLDVDKPNLEPRQTASLRIVSANAIEGEFSAVPERHRGTGLFADVVYGEDFVDLSLLQAMPGDANGDGQFDSVDLVEVFKAAEYEDEFATNSDWTEGDWNGDLEFDSGDLLVAFQFGGYTHDAISATTQAVPEPSNSLWQLAVLATSLPLMRRRVR